MIVSTSSPRLPLPFTSPASHAEPAAPGTAGRALAVVWTALKAVGAARGRRELLELAREHQATRPEFAATLRAAARRGWL